jgi:hypothetical protein
MAWDVYGSRRMGAVRRVGVEWKGLSWCWFGEAPERSWFCCPAVRRCLRQRRLSSPSARTTSRRQFPLNLAHPRRGVGRFSLSRCSFCLHPGNGLPSGIGRVEPPFISTPSAWSPILNLGSTGWIWKLTCGHGGRFGRLGGRCYQ